MTILILLGMILTVFLLSAQKMWVPVWKYTNLEPAFLFMAWIGMLFAVIGSLGALFVSLL
jgi:hypothetical protein